MQNSELSQQLENDKNNLQEAIFQSLLKWRRREGSGATFGILADALRTEARTDLAEKVLEFADLFNKEDEGEKRPKGSEMKSRKKRGKKKPIYHKDPERKIEHWKSREFDKGFRTKVEIMSPSTSYMEEEKQIKTRKEEEQEVEVAEEEQETIREEFGTKDVNVKSLLLATTPEGKIKKKNKKKRQKKSKEEKEKSGDIRNIKCILREEVKRKMEGEMKTNREVDVNEAIKMEQGEGEREKHAKKDKDRIKRSGKRSQTEGSGNQKRKKTDLEEGISKDD